MFADYLAGRVHYTAMLPVLGTRIKVYVVNNRYRGAEYGFAPLSEVGDLPTHLGCFRAGEFEVTKYDEGHLFAGINDHYVLNFKRNPGAFDYSPSTPD